MLGQAVTLLVSIWEVSGADVGYTEVKDNGGQNTTSLLAGC